MSQPRRRWLHLLWVPVVLASGAAFSAEKPRVVVLSLSTSNAKDARLTALSESVTEQLLTELGETGRIDTVGTSDLTPLLGLERQRQLMGCPDQAQSCLAEMTAALGAPWVVVGKLTRAGKTSRLDLKLLRASDGKAMWRSGHNFNDDSELFGLVSGMVLGLVAEVNPPTLEELKQKPPVAAAPAPLAPAAPVASSEPVATVTPAAEPPPGQAAQPRVAPLAVAGVGLVAALTGGALAFFTWNDQRQYAATDYRWPAGTSAPDVSAQQASANQKILAGTVVASAGAAALVGGLAWWALGKPTSAPVSVAVVPGGATLAVGGAF